MKGALARKEETRLARLVDISSPQAFVAGIKAAASDADGFTARERAAFLFAQGIARAQALRSNISEKERREFLAIAGVKVPPVSRARRARLGGLFP